LSDQEDRNDHQSPAGSPVGHRPAHVRLLRLQLGQLQLQLLLRLSKS